MWRFHHVPSYLAHVFQSRGCLKPSAEARELKNLPSSEIACESWISRTVSATSLAQQASGKCSWEPLRLTTLKPEACRSGDRSGDCCRQAESALQTSPDLKMQIWIWIDLNSRAYLHFKNRTKNLETGFARFSEGTRCGEMLAKLCWKARAAAQACFGNHRPLQGALYLNHLIWVSFYMYRVPYNMDTIWMTPQVPWAENKQVW